ncbi:swi5-like zinc finger protein [Dinochytrium kinnereticum]|nr:swi5-like zinc finger protein [Dinochytrium kinnereticum]
MIPRRRGAPSFHRRGGLLSNATPKAKGRSKGSLSFNQKQTLLLCIETLQVASDIDTSSNPKRKCYILLTVNTKQKSVKSWKLIYPTSLGIRHNPKISNPSNGPSTKNKYAIQNDDVSEVDLEILEKEVQELRENESKLRQELSRLINPLKDAAITDEEINELMNKHIKMLHEYNEAKDCAQIILGKIAETRGVTIKSIYPEYDIDMDD